jgi:hypothetical protein
MMIHHGLLPLKQDTTPRCRNCRERMDKGSVLDIETPYGATPQTRCQIWKCEKCHTMRMLKVVP